MHVPVCRSPIGATLLVVMVTRNVASDNDNDDARKGLAAEGTLPRSLKNLGQSADVGGSSIALRLSSC